MPKHNAPEWLGISEAATLAGRHDSTIRRLIPKAKPDEIRREGNKVYLHRTYLLKHFRISVQEATTAPEPAPDAESIVQLLKQQIQVKDGQISALQRDIEAKNRQVEQAQETLRDITESLKQYAALNMAQTKQITTGAPGAGVEPSRPSLAYLVAVSVGLSLIGGLLIWLVLQWASA